MLKTDAHSSFHEVLSELNYEKLSKGIYRTPWSSDAVDHLVWLRWGQKQVGALNVRYGVLHRESTEFAEKILQYLGYPLGQRPHNERKVGLITFEMAHICAWQSGLMSPELDGVERCLQNLTNCLNDSVRPQFERVTDDLTMYDFLTEAPNKGFWPPIGAARAAEAVYIGRRLGYSQKRIFRDIMLFRKTITPQLGPTKTVEDYLALVWSKG